MRGSIGTKEDDRKNGPLQYISSMVHDITKIKSRPMEKK
jgi:hypothetical protein